MSVDESPSINAHQPAKMKRKKDQQHQAAVSSSNKRRSLRDRSSLATPVAGKLSPMEIIGSLTFDIARSNEGWKVKERGVTRTFVSDCGKMTFDSFEAIGEYAIAEKGRMEKLADDEGAIGALQRLARDGDKRAIAALESLGISVEEDEEDVQDYSRPASPANRAGDAKSKSRKRRSESKSQKKGSKKKQDGKATQSAAKRGNTESVTQTATPCQPFTLAELDVTGMFHPEHNYCDVAGSEMIDTPVCLSKFSLELKDLNVAGMFDPERNYTVALETMAGENED